MENKLAKSKKNQEKKIGWRFAGTSVCGSSHEKLALPCQDAYHYEQPSAEIIMMAVADGAGSALRSDEGASIAVKVAIEHLRESYHKCLNPKYEEDIKSLILGSMNKARESVEKYAKENNVKVSEFACTLLLTCATDKFIAFAQIGDGGVVIQNDKSEIIGLTIPESSTYANETSFLVSPNALDHTQFKLWKGKAKHIAMFSDGLQYLCLQMPDGIPYDKFFKPLFKFLDSSKGQSILEKKLTEFFKSPKVRSHTDDDITLIISVFEGYK
jgi:hypothetical protein